MHKRNKNDSTEDDNFPEPEPSEYTIGYVGSPVEEHPTPTIRRKEKKSKPERRLSQKRITQEEARNNYLAKLFESIKLAQTQALFVKSDFPLATSVSTRTNLTITSGTLSSSIMFDKIVPETDYTAEGLFFWRKKKKPDQNEVEGKPPPVKPKQPDNISIRSFGSWHVGPEYHHLKASVRHTEKKVFWTTTEISKSFPRGQQAIEMSICELIMNIFFLGIITFVAFNFRPTDRFYYHDYLTKLITQTENPYYLEKGQVQYFEDIREINHIFHFLNYTFINAQWMNFFYRRQDRKASMTGMEPIFHFLGVPKVRQLRVPTNTCDIAPQLKRYISDCYAQFDPDWEQVDNIEPIQDLFRRQQHSIFLQYNKNHWVWKPVPVDYEYVIETDMGRTYPGSGYEFSLNSSRNAENLNSIKLNYLHALGWIRRESRLITIEFTLYNSNINIISSVKLLFEILPTGGVWPSFQIYNVKIFHLHSQYDHFVFGLIAAQSAFVLLFITEEAREMHFFGLWYFLRFWSWVDLCIIALVLAQQYNLILVLQQSQEYVTVFLNNRNSYFEMDNLVYYDTLHDTFLMCNVFLSFYKLFRYIDYYGNVDRFTRTLKMATPALGLFIIRFAIIYCAYVQLGFFLFGSYNVEFASRARGVLSLLRMYYGYYNYAGLTRLQPYFGAAFFIGGVTVLYAMCLGFFLVVFYNFYLVNELVTTVTRGPSAKGMLTCLCKKLYYLRLRVIRTRQKPTLPIGNITYQELIEAMEIMNFTKPELDILKCRCKLLPENTTSACEVYERILILQDEIKRNIMRIIYPRARGVEVEPPPKFKMMTSRDFIRIKLLITSIEILTSILDERTYRLVLYIKRFQRYAYKHRMEETEEKAYRERICDDEIDRRRLELQMQGLTESEIDQQIEWEEYEKAQEEANEEMEKKRKKKKNKSKDKK